MFGAVQIDQSQGGSLEVQVSIKDIAMTAENAILEIFAFNSKLDRIDGIVMDNLKVDTGTTNLTEVFQIARGAAAGTANATAILLASDRTQFNSSNQ